MGPLHGYTRYTRDAANRPLQVTPIVQQLMGRTAWGELDFLVIDL